MESYAPEKIELAKVSERSLDLIEPKDLERLLKAPDGDDLKSLRDKAILELLFSTGLRVSELCSLPRELDLKKMNSRYAAKVKKCEWYFCLIRPKKRPKISGQARRYG